MMTEDKEKTLDFIADYRSYRALWDPKHRYYSNKAKRNIAWIAISKKQKMDVLSVKNKVKSLRSYFAKEHRKMITLDAYESTWFAYKYMYFIWDSSEAMDDEENSLDDISDKSPDHEVASEVDPISAQVPDANRAKDNRVGEKERPKRNYVSDRDECRMFGDLIAHKLRKLNPRNRLLAQHRINNMFFDLELEELDSDNTTPVIKSVISVPTKMSPKHP